MILFENEIARRQERFESALEGLDGIILVSCGAAFSKPGGLDQTYPFIAHPEYYWLTGSRRPNAVIAYDSESGWTHFVTPVSADERLWEGDAVAPIGRALEELPAWLEARSGRRKAMLGQWTHDNVPNDAEFTELAQQKLNIARRPKDSAEIDMLRTAIRATAAGHARAMEFIRPGVSERAVQIELEAAMFRSGADEVGYASIVGSGYRSAVLHGHPSERVLAKNEFVLVDAGASVNGYTADVTRTLCTGKMNAQRQHIYDIVLAAELAGIDACRAGVEWHDIHRTSAIVIAQGLVDLKILIGDTEALADRGAVSIFFPHGVGHMLGLGVRDVGGWAPDRKPGRTSCGASVRVDLPLERGFVMTVEPGLYFVDAIIDSPSKRSAYRDDVRWDELDKWRGIGGVRIEDDILITSSGPPEVLTGDIPK
jgi:Xaa-Pro aminopeptidase